MARTSLESWSCFGLRPMGLKMMMTAVSNDKVSLVQTQLTFRAVEQAINDGQAWNGEHETGLVIVDHVLSHHLVLDGSD